MAVSHRQKPHQDSYYEAENRASNSLPHFPPIHPPKQAALFLPTRRDASLSIMHYHSNIPPYTFLQQSLLRKKERKKNRPLSACLLPYPQKQWSKNTKKKAPTIFFEKKKTFRKSATLHLKPSQKRKPETPCKTLYPSSFPTATICFLPLPLVFPSGFRFAVVPALSEPRSVTGLSLLRSVPESDKSFGLLLVTRLPRRLPAGVPDGVPVPVPIPVSGSGVPARLDTLGDLRSDAIEPRRTRPAGETTEEDGAEGGSGESLFFSFGFRDQGRQLLASRRRMTRASFSRSQYSVR